jgi:integrase
MASLPISLSDEEIAKLLNAFDRSSAIGRRDYAITRCFVDLGLRTTEIARLRLEDVDWREGTLRIRGKSRRIDVLPLPQLTGNAIVEYLRNGRPATTKPRTFHPSSPAARHVCYSLYRPQCCTLCRQALRSQGLFQRATSTPPLGSETAPARGCHSQADRRYLASPLSRYHHDLREDRSSSARARRPSVAREVSMKTRDTMCSKVRAYLEHRRRAGFALKIEAEQLFRFARFVDESVYRGPATVELASRWAMASWSGRRLTAARRIEVLRGFARYCQIFDPAAEIPPLGLFGSGHRRLTPHIYTDGEIRSLLASAKSLFPLGGLRGVTCATIFGLIVATGLRISEATGLKHSDVDLERGLLQIRNAKFGKTRFVPLHLTATRALRRYAKRRDRDPSSFTTEAFFVFDYGRAATTRSLEYAFQLLRNKLKWRARGGHPAPRIQDIRHTFVRRRLERWYREGLDVDCNILALSTYIGHAKVTDTYWYVTATPDLMAIAARKLRPPMLGGTS